MSRVLFQPVLNKEQLSTGLDHTQFTDNANLINSYPYYCDRILQNCASCLNNLPCFNATLRCITVGTKAYIFTPNYSKTSFNILTFFWPCISVYHASTCFEHMVLIIRRSKLHYTASGIITPIGGQPVHEMATYRCDDNQRLCNAILTSWWWAPCARNM